MTNITNENKYNKTKINNTMNIQSQKWKVGKHLSTVVSDTKIRKTNFPLLNIRESADYELEYYGGYLVCESIGNIEIAKLIAEAPELLRCLKQAIEYNERSQEDYLDEWSSVVARIEGKDVLKQSYSAEDLLQWMINERNTLKNTVQTALPSDESISATIQVLKALELSIKYISASSKIVDLGIKQDEQ